MDSDTSEDWSSPPDPRPGWHGVVAINDLTNPQPLHISLKYDKRQGRFEQEVKATEDKHHSEW